MIVCERLILFGGARGPPGMAGVDVTCAGRGFGGADAGGGLESRLREEEAMELEEEEDTALEETGFPRIVPERSRFEILFLRPREKNPVLGLVVIVVGKRTAEDALRMEDNGGVERATEGALAARDGYGNAGGGGMFEVKKSSPSCTDRSVAVYASGRRGKVASEAIDDRETCLV
jgi:hypothetical protein